MRRGKRRERDASTTIGVELTETSRAARAPLTGGSLTPILTVMSSDYSKSLFIAPHTKGNPLPPDLTRLPAPMRDALHRPDPIRDNEACGHLQTHKPPISVPGARVRFYVLEEPNRAPRVGMKIIATSGDEVLAQIYFDGDQAVIAHEAFSAILADSRIARLIPGAETAVESEVVPAPVSPLSALNQLAAAVLVPREELAPGEVPSPFPLR
jgi:hypothetical protein